MRAGGSQEEKNAPIYFAIHKLSGVVWCPECHQRHSLLLFFFFLFSEWVYNLTDKSPVHHRANIERQTNT